MFVEDVDEEGATVVVEDALPGGPGASAVNVLRARLAAGRQKRDVARAAAAAAVTAAAWATRGRGGGETSRGRGRGRQSGRGGAAADLAVVASDDDVDAVSSSSSMTTTSPRSRSRSRGRTKQLGAAAAAALITAVEPLDVDACNEIQQQKVQVPTEAVMQLQHSGRLTAIMAETGAVLSVSPTDDLQSSLVLASGSPAAVGRALWQVESCCREQGRAGGRVGGGPSPDRGDKEREVLDELQIPEPQLHAVIGYNGCLLPEIRALCGQIMIAVCPPTEKGGNFVACLGPGRREDVQRGLQELRSRLDTAMGQKKT